MLGGRGGGVGNRRPGGGEGGRWDLGCLPLRAPVNLSYRRGCLGRFWRASKSLSVLGRLN